jgi:adenylate cyclase
MKRTILGTLTLSIILITVQTVYAQTPTKELKLDSLVNANERYQKQDLTKLRLLNNLTAGYVQVNPAKGIETGEQAIALAQKLSNQLLLAEAYNNKGVNHVAKRDYPTAMELYEKALAINQNLKNTFGIATNTLNIGNIFRVKRDNKKAKETFEQALLLFEGIPDKGGIAKCYNSIGNIYSSLSDNPKALEYFQKALAIFEQLGNKAGMAANLSNIGIVYSYLSDYPKALEYFQKALAINEQLGNKASMAENLNSIGLAYSSLSNYPKALEYQQKALTINEQLGIKSGVAGNFNNIGIIYDNLSNYPKALEYYQKALAINEQLGNKNWMARNLGNIGNVYESLSDYPKALEYYQIAIAIFEQLGDKDALTYGLDKIGIVYAFLSDYPKALEYFQKALAINEQLKNKNGIASNLGNFGIIYRDAPDSVLLNAGINPTQRYEKALEYQNKSLQINQEIGDVSMQKNAWTNLSTTYEKQGDYAKAHDAYKNYIVLRDSIESGKIKGQIERKTMQYEFDKKETALKFEQQLTQEKLVQSQQEARLGSQALQLSNKEKDLQRLAYLQTQAELHEQQIIGENQLAQNGKKDADLKLLGKEKDLKQSELELSQAEVQSKSMQRNGFIAGFAVVLLFAGVFARQRNRIKKGKQRSDDLLLNILPEDVAEELKDRGSAAARQFDEVTVLFTDFKDFTQISETMTPTELVQEIHECFTAFDQIIHTYNIEKIKTIGDSYMCAGGLPVTNDTHPVDVVQAALEIQDFIQKHAQKRISRGLKPFEIRIGVHTGPVVAGIVGIKKFAYDIWGATVNTASRMESSGEVGRVNVSGTTFELIKGRFKCTYRGKIEAKHKGDIDMYFVESRI